MTHSKLGMMLSDFKFASKITQHLNCNLPYAPREFLSLKATDIIAQRESISIYTSGNDRLFCGFAAC